MKVPGVPITPGSCGSGQKGQDGALAEAPECVDISVWQKTRESSPLKTGAELSLKTVLSPGSPRGHREPSLKGGES